MNAAAPPDPFALLQDLARIFASAASQLPAQAEYAPVATLIAFQLAGCSALVDLDCLSEILPVSNLTRLPQVQPWLHGIANVRGKLLPVVDGAGFLGQTIDVPAKHQRILVMVSDDFSAGIIVDRVDGLRHFAHDAFRERPEIAPGPLHRYVAGGLIDVDQRILPLFDPAMLFEDPAFRDASLSK
jgi:twitching motility protein PilI